MPPAPVVSNFRVGSLATVFLCDMNKSVSNTGFWQTLDLLIGNEWRKNDGVDVDGWVDRVVQRREFDKILEEDEEVPESEKSEPVEKVEQKEGSASVKEFFESLDLPRIECT